MYDASKGSSDPGFAADAAAAKRVLVQWSVGLHVQWPNGTEHHTTAQCNTPLLQSKLYLDGSLEPSQLLATGKSA